jgi:endonuclease III
LRLWINVEDYDLDRTLKPSFVSSLYQQLSKGRWLKIAGYLGGCLEFRQLKPSLVEVRSSVEVEGLSRDLSVLELGLWHDPFEELIHTLPSRAKVATEGLARVYPGLRLPVASRDMLHIVVAVTLSKRTSYDRFVLSWCRGIWEKYDKDLKRVASLGPSSLKEVGTSYQLQQLRRTLESFLEMPERLPKKLRELVPMKKPIDLLRADPEIARFILLSCCWGLGPKTADSIVLSTFKAPFIMPCDVHLKTVSIRLGLIEEGRASLPSKHLCSRHACDRPLADKLGVKLCPAKESCLKSNLSYFNEAGGWFQTLTYLFGKDYCRTLNPKCQACPLKPVCDFA